MNPLYHHHQSSDRPGPAFRNPTRAVVIIISAALWVCICIALVWALLTSCASPVVTVTLAPAIITCTDAAQADPVQTIAVDSAVLVNGIVTTITVDGQTAPFDAAGLACSAVEAIP